MTKSFHLPVIIVLLLILNCSDYLYAQQNVGIGTTTPDSSSILDLTSADKGFLIPRVTLNDAGTPSPVSNPATGLLIYNLDGTEPHGFWYWDGAQWVQVGSGGGSGDCFTLDQAYDCGGGGAGRIITADSGSVQIDATVASTIGLKAAHSDIGVAISATSNHTSNSFATVQVTTASNYGTIGGTPSPTSGIISNSSGKAYGICGQIESTASAESGIFGNNLRTNGGHGVLGQGFNGTVGQAFNQEGFGVYGLNASIASTGNAIGVAGTGYVGVWGE
ncbi:MAG: hypothetical protein KJ607_03790, partial [Bacteroidetes bacterium]|nr:hypothetical protein [Bacteroidota bacterium]